MRCGFPRFIGLSFLVLGVVFRVPAKAWAAPAAHTEIRRHPSVVNRWLLMRTGVPHAPAFCAGGLGRVSASPLRDKMYPAHFRSARSLRHDLDA
jgi:hypothetical protein